MAQKQRTARSPRTTRSDRITRSHRRSFRTECPNDRSARMARSDRRVTRSAPGTCGYIWGVTTILSPGTCDRASHDIWSVVLIKKPSGTFVHLKGKRVTTNNPLFFLSLPVFNLGLLLSLKLFYSCLGISHILLVNPLVVFGRPTSPLYQIPNLSFH
jgi:hypothetical protein